MPAKIEINRSGVQRKDTVQQHFFYVRGKVKEESGYDSRCHRGGQKERCFCLMQKEKQERCRKQRKEGGCLPAHDQ